MTSRSTKSAASWRSARCSAGSERSMRHKLALQVLGRKPSGRPMPRPPRPLLSRDRIVETAAALVDAEGLAALSTRRLAAELGVRGPSLYNHFPTKEAILDAVADAVLREVDVSAF